MSWRASPWRTSVASDPGPESDTVLRAPVELVGMLSRQFVREHPDVVREGLALRGTDDVDVDEILTVDEEWREHKSRGDDLRRRRNEISSRIGELKQAGDETEAQAAIERSQELKAELEAVEKRADELERRLEELLLDVPNVPQESVPPGEDERDNEERRRVGFDELRELPDGILPHYNLGEQLEILDFDRAATVSGGGFYFLKGDGARLEHALVQFMRDVHREQGYTEVFPPIPVTSESMTGTGQLPKFTEDAYRVGGHNDEPYGETDLWLCPTAEVPVTNMYADDTLLADELPLKHQAYTPNFRREAGEHGTETRGIVRVHQFNKVELVNFVEPSNSDERLEQLVDEAEEVLRRLDLPYRVTLLCGGDLTFASARTFDIEVWAPADDMDDGPDRGGRWLEVSSASNFEAFQARRIGLRYRPERHESAEYLHTLNASGLALPRVMVAVLEYYQNPDGTVTVPEALRPYMGGQERIEGHEPIGEAAVGAGRKD
jgi:seryl-tRNA synthetase